MFIIQNCFEEDVMILDKIFTEKKLHIEGHLQDDLSRKIFHVRYDAVCHRLLHDSVVRINQTVEKFDYIRTTDGTEFTREKTRQVVIFGAGYRGRLNAIILEKAGIDIVAFADNDVLLHGAEIDGIRVISAEDLTGHFKEYPVVISNEFSSFSIKEQLLEMGIKEERIVLAPGIRADNHGQYFDVFSPQEDEIFVDAGCYRGETSMRFIKWCDGRYDKIYAFEADHRNWESCRDVFALGNVTRVQLENKGLYDHTGMMRFSADATGESHLTDNDDAEEIEVTTLDEVLDGAPVTFVKMDIEGAEEAALQGARQTIIRHKPRLAISVYHKMTDILTIPEMLLEMVPEYRFWFRHYTASLNDTVLYAEV